MAQDALPEEAAKKPHETLLELFDQNERAIAYHKHCVSARIMPPLQFLDNANYITVQLQQALLAAYPDKTREEVEQGLLARAAYLQKQNTRTYHEQGCEERWAQSTKRYYDMMVKMDTAFVQSYVVNRVQN